MAVTDLLFRMAGYAFTVANDFMPKKSMEEFSLAVGEVQRRLFGGAPAEPPAQAALTATRAAHAVLAQSGAPPAVVKRLHDRARILAEALTPLPIRHDPLAGTLSEGVGPKPRGWVQASRHPSTLGFFAGALGGVARRLVEDPDAREQAIQVLTQLHLHRRLLASVRNKLAPEHRATVDDTLAALDVALKVVVHPASGPTPAGGTAATGREEIRID